MNAFNIKNLEKKYGSTVAVNIPLLNIEKGTIVGFLGNNGAGKTTLFRLMLDLIKSTKGEIRINGMDVSKDDRWKNITGSYLDTNFLIEFLTAKEFFYFTGTVYKLSNAEINNRIIGFEKFMNNEIIINNKFIHDLSSGNKQKVGIISSMIIYPDILILDEPFNFLDPSSQIELKCLLEELNSKYNTTIIISSHNINHIMDISSRIILLEKGIIIKDLNNKSEKTKSELQHYFELYRE
jgi:ABC-2 type transport system ATP-binding protein